MWGLVAAGAASALGGKSAKKAAKEQAAALDRATAEQQRQYDQTRADLQPFRDYGQGGITALSDPNANFYASADYAFRRSEGERGIGSSFAARGGAYSGRAMKALADYNSNLASGEFGNWYTRQENRVRTGLGATDAVVNAGQQTSNNIANLYADQGAVKAAGIEANSNAILGGLNNAINLYAMSRPTGTVFTPNTRIPRMTAAYVPNTRGYA